MGKLYNMVKVAVSGTPGTGTITLGSAVSGFQTFAQAGVPNAAVVSYNATDGAAWEIGRGTYTSSGTTLTRGPLFSSSAGSAVNLTSAAQVAITLLAEDLVPGTLVTYHDLDTRSTAQSLTLPASPVDGEQHRIKDVYGNAATNNITVGAGGTLLIDSATTLIMSAAYQSNTCRWSVSLNKWLVE